MKLSKNITYNIIICLAKFKVIFIIETKDMAISVNFLKRWEIMENILHTFIHPYIKANLNILGGAS